MLKDRQEKIRNHVKNCLKNKNPNDLKIFSNQLKKFMKQKNSFNKCSVKLTKMLNHFEYKFLTLQYSKS